jgi:hypothetical protein
MMVSRSRSAMLYHGDFCFCFVCWQCQRSYLPTTYILRVGIYYIFAHHQGRVSVCVKMSSIHSSHRRSAMVVTTIQRMNMSRLRVVVVASTCMFLCALLMTHHYAHAQMASCDNVSYNTCETQMEQLATGSWSYGVSSLDQGGVLVHDVPIVLRTTAGETSIPVWNSSASEVASFFIGQHITTFYTVVCYYYLYVLLMLCTKYYVYSIVFYTIFLS